MARVNRAERDDRGRAAKAAMASQAARVPVRERQQCQPPSVFWAETSQSRARWTRGSSPKPKRTIMRTALPVMQVSLPGSPQIPSFGWDHRSSSSFAARSMRGSRRVNSRSARTISRKFVEMYLGT